MNTGGAANAEGSLRVRPVGDRACVIDLEHLTDVLALSQFLRRMALPGVIDIVPAMVTVLVRCDSRAAVRRVASAVRGWRPGDAQENAAGPGTAYTIDVVYDGADLAAVAAATNLSATEVIRAHTMTPWRAAFGGFAPGFLYLVGGDARLRVPRLDSPRTSVPAGSVALAGEFSAVYPGESPGGWQLIGHTDTPLWRPNNERPSLLAPGDTVTFRAVRGLIAVAGSGQPSGPPRCNPGDAPSYALTVIDSGMLTLIQDSGRPGNAAIGVTQSGALDRGALARANTLLGNDPGAAALEVLDGGLIMEAGRAIVVATAGAQAAITVSPATAQNEAAVPPYAAESGTPIELGPGDRLRLAAPTQGLRTVVAVLGGIAGASSAGVSVLGSVSSDTLSGLGPAPLRAGDRIALAADEGAGIPLETAPTALPPNPLPQHGSNAEPATGHDPVLRFVPGPRDDWFSAASRQAFVAQAWQVTAQSNRIGLRLAGPPLERADSAEHPAAAQLPSEGMVCGSIQVPPNGQPVLFLADHPVTGGYPVIGTVVDEDLDRVAQLRPGSAVTFVAVAPDDIGQPRGSRGDPPARVSFSIEVEGRRHELSIPGEIAAALDRAAATGDTGLTEQIIAQAIAPLIGGANG